MKKLITALLAISALVLTLGFTASPVSAAGGGQGGSGSQAAPNQGGGNPNMLNISSIECVANQVNLHFVLVQQTFTEAQLRASTLTVTYKVNGGATQTATVAGNTAFEKISGGVAHFNVRIPGVTGSVTVTGQSLSIAGQTIQLHNTLTQGNLNCGVPPVRPVGNLKVCKALAAGTTVPAGTLFTFSVGTTPARNLSVAPGTCALVEGIPVGNVVVTETGPPGYEVTAIVFLAGTGTVNVAGRSATATIVANATTEVQFTNRVIQLGNLKVCKALAAGTTVAAGTLFTFTVGTRTISVAPGTCALVENLPVGTVVVTETGPGGFTVTEIVFLAGTGTVDLAGRRATANIVANATTEVRFTNRRNTGFIQICKETTGGLTGTFTFTSPVVLGGAVQTINVAAGATQPVCIGPFEVPAGTVVVTEGALPANVEFVSGRTVPAARLVGFNVAARTVTANIPAGAAADQTQIIFLNRPIQKGNLQICKETEGGLTGTFTFTSPSFAGTQSVIVTAGATQPVCTGLIEVNAGSVTITEGAGGTLTSVRTTPADRLGAVNLAGRAATVTVLPAAPGNQTVAIFHNRA